MFRLLLLRALCGLVGLVFLFPTGVAAQPVPTTGTVIDISGAAIPAADVTGQTADGRTIAVVADASGHFAFQVAVTRVTVTSTGFAAETVAVGESGAPLTVVLRPSNFADSVVVTATRTQERLPSAASATVITAAELNNSAAGALDDTLRQTPGFSLFRRSSSRVANPTTQGVTLRGVSGSGSSRTLVLADGMPLNDPFGSWVYWNRIPQAAIDRVEVVRGATGDLYGAGALGGVIQILTVQPERTRVRATVDGGSHDTFRGSVFAGATRNGWAGTAGFEGVRTDGAYTVAPEARGPVDTKADSDYETGLFSGGRRTDTIHLWVRGAAYSEARGNGTPLQVNTTGWSQISADVGGVAGQGVWQAQMAGSSQDYYQTFTAVAGDRASERLTTKQTTGTEHRMFNGQWTQPYRKMTLVVGGDYHHTDSDVSELRYSLTNVETGPFIVGGKERLGAAYARATITATDALTFELGGRGDWWKSEPLDAAQPTKSLNFFSPRASVAWRAGRHAIKGAVYHASRTPTLNELHRGFRAGNVVTNPNPLLEPEILTGFEVGVLGSYGDVSLRGTVFFSDLDQAIANITLTSTPAQITRQRQNSDSIRAQGAEFEVDARLSRTLSVAGQMVFTSSHFRGSEGTPAVEGKNVPQVPEVQGGFSLSWVDPRWFTASTQVRFSSEQYDDDLNEFILGAYGVWDAQFSRAVVRGLTGFLAIENILDQVYDTGRTPIRTVGWPRTVRFGVRVSWQ
jgi:outer membrane receptor protein involved in Fe transport